MFKWVGSLPGSREAGCIVQVVDNAGNVQVDANKGQYYVFAPKFPFGVWLPLVLSGP
jgi:hypothetical protein